MSDGWLPRGSTGVLKRVYLTEAQSMFPLMTNKPRFSVANNWPMLSLSGQPLKVRQTQIPRQRYWEKVTFTVSGVKIKVKEITEKVGACSVGTGEHLHVQLMTEYQH